MDTYVKLLETGVAKGYISISEDNARITYVKQNKTYRFSDPEEKVRASYYVELIEKYQYLPDRIGLEVTVPRRTPNDLADIVVFRDEDKKQPYIVVECKRDGISDSEFEQTIEQAFGNTNSLRASYAAVVAGNTQRFYDAASFPSSEREKNIIADIPINYGKIQEFRYKKGDKNWDIEAVDKNSLIRILEKCNDTLWDGGRVDAIESFDELCKIIFVKIRDEKTARRVGQPYDFQIKTHENAVSVYERIKKLYNDAKNRDPEVFTDSIKCTPQKMLTVVNHLQGINLNKTDLDIKGVAFEVFMEDFFKGKQGQYFTPREIVDFIVKICDIDTEMRILDPACGSGGFLLHALDHIRTQAKEYYDEGTTEHYKYWHDFAAGNLFGIENNERIARVAKMNMIIHDDGHTNIICHDALDNIEKMNRVKQGFEKESFHLIITNPPFGASVKKEENPYLNDFILGKNKQGKDRKTQSTEVLFIERCWEFLKYETGRIAIILPDGILTNITLNYVRRFMKDKFEIEGIFSLPQVTFAHYGAGVKSSIMIMRKKGKNELEKDSNVFCSVINNVGYDATGRKDKSDLDDIANKFKEFKKGTLLYSHSVYVKPISKLCNDRLDAYYYSPLFEDIINDIRKTNFPLLSLGDVCKGDISEHTIFNGSTPSKEDYSESKSDPKIVKVASLKNGRVNFDLLENVLPAAAGNKTINDGDILILSSAHQAEYIGKNPSIVEIPAELLDEDINFVGELINIRANKSIVNPYYLLQLLNTERYYLLINREKRGQTSHLYPRDLKNILVPVPEDIAIQNKNANNYKSNYEEYTKLIKKAEKKLKDSSEEFESSFFDLN